jgi:4-aminobutyrate aminotransferase-like enzyme
MLRELCDERQMLLIVDEVYTGVGRTGAWFGCEHSSTVPDLICLGKALTGGFPLSACVGRSELMDCWPESTGEAIHTSTFLGHPVGCAMALAQLAEVQRRHLVERSARLGRKLQQWLGAELRAFVDAGEAEVRGAGLMTGVALRNADALPDTERALAVMRRMLERGYIVLPEGEHAEVIALTPPLVISETVLKRAVRALAEVLKECPARCHRPGRRA